MTPITPDLLNLLERFRQQAIGSIGNLELPDQLAIVLRQGMNEFIDSTVRIELNHVNDKPNQQTILNGTIQMVTGTISLADVPGQNVYWQMVDGNNYYDGQLTEMFVSGKNVYGIWSDGNPTFTSINYTDPWLPVSKTFYNDLRSTATKIVVGKITPIPTPPVTPPAT
jgi:hypothetical protein